MCRVIALPLENLPLPRRRVQLPEPVFVEQQQQIDDLCARCRAEGRFAFDTEFVMEDRYEAQVCLIQIATGSSAIIIDPFLDLDLRGVWDLVCDAQIETVVHAGQEDLAVCVRHAGDVPRRVFDVQIAAGFAGYDYPLSLQRLVQATLHVRLHKTKTLTDWRRRPLTAEQITYGAEDVCYLLAVRDILHERLVRLDRLEWVGEEFQRFEETTLYDRATEDRLKRLKGTGTLKGQQLAVVRELLLWRDEFAKQVNRPARTVLKDHLLVEIARHSMQEARQIRELRGLNLSNRGVRAVAGVVQRALALPSEEWPEVKPAETESGQEAALVSLVTAVIRSYCVENNLAYGLVATQKSIRQLIRHRVAGVPDNREVVELLNGWQGRSVGVIVDEVLAGRRTVRVEPLDGGCGVHVSPRDNAEGG